MTMTPKNLGTALLCVFMTASCATINPYVLPYEAAPEKAGDDKPPRTCTDSEHPSVCKLRQFQAELGRKLKEHTVMGAVSGSLLMPLASIIAYKGATGAGAHNIAALSAGGFAGYGTVQYLYKRPRELIYVSGISALDCAIRVSQPYLWKESKESQARISDASETVLSLKEMATNFAQDYRSNRATQLEQELLGTGDVLRARLELARAGTAQRRALSSQYEAEMLAAAYRVVAEVNKQLALLAPDPESLQSKLGGLALPTAPAPPPPGDAPEDDNPPEPISNKYAAYLNQELEEQQQLEKTLKTISERLTREIRNEVRLEAFELSLGTDTRDGSARLRAQKEANRHRSMAEAREREKAVVDHQLDAVSKELEMKQREELDFQDLTKKRDEAITRVLAAEADTPPEVRPPDLIDYAECGINQPSGLIESAIEANPNTIELALSATGTIYITDAIGAVSASVVSRPEGEPSDALTASVKQLGPGMAEITLISTDKFLTGSHAILVRDAVGGAVLIPVQNP